MRQNSRELYDALHHTYVGKMCTDIFSLTTYNRLNYMQKYRALVKLFCMAMNKSMNAYQTRLHWTCTYMTVHPTKIPPHVNRLRLHYRINLHTKTTTHAIIQKSRKTSIINIFTDTYPYNHTYNTHSLKTQIYHFIHYKPSTKSSHLILSCPTYRYLTRWLAIPWRRPIIYS